MPIRRLPVGRLTALLALLVAATFIVRGHAGPHFRTLGPGFEFATFRGEPYCRRGSSQIAVMRLDPARTRVRMHHYTQEPEQQPLTIVEWQRRTGALAVFNAGQYYPDLSYMGVLVSGGKVISGRLHPRFKAALVADPVRGGPAARVLDLEDDPLDPDALGWREVAQSFMLFDHRGTLRVRKSTLIANRTAVAEDREGRLLVITTEGGYTLPEFVRLLREEPLHLSQAMSMDGGSEAELCVKIDSFRYASFGEWNGDAGAAAAAGARVELPAVVTVGAR
jgi:phosphodiester glycosidase